MALIPAKQGSWFSPTMMCPVGLRRTFTPHVSTSGLDVPYKCSKNWALALNPVSTIAMSNNFFMIRLVEFLIVQLIKRCKEGLQFGWAPRRPGIFNLPAEG